MTFEEALKAIIYLANNMPIELHNRRLLEAISKSIEALQKQIPKEPIVIEDKMWTCPVCGNNLLYKWEDYPIIPKDREYGFPVCLSCFQAIDWSDTE